MILASELDELPGRVAPHVRIELGRVTAVLDGVPEGQLGIDLAGLRRGARGRCDEEEVLHERRVLPRNLLAACLLAHGESGPLEDLLDLEPGLREVAKEIFRVDTVLTGAVRGDRARRGRKCHERADGGVHGRETARGGAEAPRERVVAAGVEDHDVQSVLGAVHLAQHQVHLDPLGRDLVLTRDVRVHRDEKVLTAHLHPVPGEIEQADAAVLDGIAELAEGVAHLALRGILELGDRESE